MREISVLGAYVVLLVLMAIVAPSFFTAANLRDVMLGNIPVLVTAIGMSMVILIGEIDISVAAQFAIYTVLAGLSAKAGVPVPLVALIVPVAGMIIGAGNGVLIAGLGLPSIVVTLASMVILRDCLRWSTGGAWVQDLPRNFQWMGMSQGGGELFITAAALVVFAIFAWVLRHLAAGRAIYAVGSDAEASRLAGVPVSAVRVSVFCAMGALTAVAALLNSIRFSELQSNAGAGLEIKAIAAVVVGGASISGGRGTLKGTLLGVILLGTIGPALTFLGINPYWEKAIQGGIILFAVAADLFTVRFRQYATVSASSR